MQRSEQPQKRKIPDEFFSTGYGKKTFGGHDTTDTEDTEDSDAETVNFRPLMTRTSSPQVTRTGPLTSFRPQSSSITTAEGCENIFPNPGPMVSAELPTSVNTPIRPAIQNAIEKDGEFLFLFGLDSPIWVHYYQVKQSPQVRGFLQTLSKREWMTFFTEREDEEVEGGDLRIGNTGEELPVEKVFKMRIWGGQWMLLIEVGTVELDISDVEGLGLVDDAVEFCIQKHDWGV